MTSLPRRDPITARIGLLAVSTVLSCAAGYWAYDRYRTANLSGIELNVAAWEASYRERGETVPPGGPREGYWGERLGQKVPDRYLHHHEREIHVPGLIDIDGDGLQHASNSPEPRHRILLIGGSVAFGAYASSIDNTYFVQMLKILGDRGYALELTVDAAGAWTSFNETAAYRTRGLRAQPEVVMFLDGLNDLSQARPEVTRRPVESYIANMRLALALSRRSGVRMVAILQPLLAAKRFKTSLEQRILEFPAKADRGPDTPADWPQRYVDAFATFRRALTQMSRTLGGMSFVDCSDALSEQRETTFADFWHFGDAGHRLLARCVAEGLAPVLDSLP